MTQLVSGQTLRIIIQQEYETNESFIRYGPVERIKSNGDGFVGFYPWRLHKSGGVILTSAEPHYLEIVKFVNGHVKSIPKTESFSNLGSVAIFYITFWVIYLSLTISRGTLYSIIMELVQGTTKNKIKNILYSMKIAGWIDFQSYSGKDYLFACHDVDPFHYAFKNGVVDNDSVRRKAIVSAAISKFEQAPKHIRDVAADRRGQP